MINPINLEIHEQPSSANPNLVLVRVYIDGALILNINMKGPFDETVRADFESALRSLCVQACRDACARIGFQVTNPALAKFVERVVNQYAG